MSSLAKAIVLRGVDLPHGYPDLVCYIFFSAQQFALVWDEIIINHDHDTKLKVVHNTTGYNEYLLCLDSIILPFEYMTG
ncbi:hypothetical protein ACJX0J_014898, partial [Zea mays]